MAKDFEKHAMRINLELEKSKISREKSLIVLNKGFFIYLMILFVAVMGVVNGLITTGFLNAIIALGLIILIAGIVPYMFTMNKEERVIQKLIDELDKK